MLRVGGEHHIKKTFALWQGLMREIENLRDETKADATVITLVTAEAFEIREISSHTPLPGGVSQLARKNSRVFHERNWISERVQRIEQPLSPGHRGDLCDGRSTGPKHPIPHVA